MSRNLEDPDMSGKREKPEDIVTKLRQVEVLQGQGMTVVDAVANQYWTQSLPAFDAAS